MGMGGYVDVVWIGYGYAWPCWSGDAPTNQLLPLDGCALYTVYQYRFMLCCVSRHVFVS